jgi:hypothetical protein
MTLAAAEHLAVLVFVSMLIAGAAVSVTALLRVRRAWRDRRRAWMFAAFRGGLAGRVSTAAVGASLAETVASPAWWLVQRDRHAMWRCVSAARRAVAVAARAGAPTGDLTALARRLERSAAGVDALLRAAGADRSAAARVAGERARIVTAAAEIRDAALASLAAMSADVQPVASAVAVEVEALAAGVRAARATQPAR